MEKRKRAISQLIGVHEARKANITGWTKDVNLYYEQMERVVKQQTVELQAQIKAMAVAVIRQLKDECTKLIHKVDAEATDAAITQLTKELYATNVSLNLSAHEMSEKIMKGELSLEVPADPEPLTVPIPCVILTPFLNKLQVVSGFIDSICVSEVVKFEEEESTELVPFSEPASQIEEGSTHEVHIHSQWATNTGKFAVRLVDPKVDENITKLSMHIRQHMLSNPVLSYEQQGKVPEKGDRVLTTFHGSWYRGLVADLKQEKKLCRVQMIDYGNFESRSFAEVWPYTQTVGREEPAQMIECTVLEDLTDARSPTLTNARWTFNRLVQTYMQECAGNSSFYAKFRRKVDIGTEFVWLVDLNMKWKDESVDLTQRVRAQINDNGGKPEIECRDIRYTQDEIQTVYVNPKLEVENDENTTGTKPKIESSAKTPRSKEKVESAKHVKASPVKHDDSNTAEVDTVDGMVDPRTMDTVDGMIDPQKVDTVDGMIKPQEVDTVDGIIQPPEVDAVDGMIKPQEVDTVDGMIKSPEVDAVDGIIESPEVDAVDGMIKPPEVDAVDGIIESPEVDTVDGMIKPPEVDAVDGIIDPPEVDTVDGIIKPPEVDAVDGMIQPQKVDTVESIIDPQKVDTVDGTNDSKKVESNEDKCFEEALDIDTVDNELHMQDDKLTNVNTVNDGSGDSCVVKKGERVNDMAAEGEAYNNTIEKPQATNMPLDSSVNVKEGKI